MAESGGGVLQNRFASFETRPVGRSLYLWFIAVRA